MKRRSSFAAVVALCLCASPLSAQTFEVHRVSDDSVALTGTLADASASADLPAASLADFSALSEPGEYYLSVPGVGKSVTFRVGTDVYDNELATLMLGFYGWRSGVDVAFDYRGTHFEHAAGHLADGLLDYVDGQVGVSKDGTGGWYDAGDYGKYLPTASESVGNMLFAWEQFSPRLEKLVLPYLPDQVAGVPDFLVELKWELDWILKMAYDDGSGRVHHKLNSPTFPGFILPADDHSKRYFSNFSSAATAEFAATLAKASRAFAPYDALTGGYSQKLLAAAQTAYAYLSANLDNVQYDASVLAAGTYQKLGTDDRIWAAAEMWETTGDPAAFADIEQRIGTGTGFVPNFDWDNMTAFGLITYLRSQRPGKDPKVELPLRDRLVAIADRLVASRSASSYGRDIEPYYWGSNGVIARSCLLLQSAYELNPKPEYLDTCADQISYLYGRNQYNRSQVTGSGIEPPLHPHARISGSDNVDAPYPGLLVGGGQSATGWQDTQANFQTNEVAINWNAALVYALAGFIEGRGADASPERGPVAAEACQIRLSSVGFLPERSKVATIATECGTPDTFQCALPAQTLSGDTSGKPSLIDDVEDGDTQILPNAGRNGGWFAFDDGTAGTRTGAEVKSAGRSGSKSAMCISGQGFTGFGGGIGVSFVGQGGARTLYDASAYTGISFWARGSATQFRAMLVDKYSDPSAALCSGCYDHFQAPFTPSAEWKQYTFAWPELRQLGFGDMHPNVCAAGIYALQFQWSGSTPFELCLDDIAFTTPAGQGGGDETVDVSPRGGGCGCRLAPASESGVVGAVGFAALALLVVTRRGRARYRDARRAASLKGES